MSIFTSSREPVCLCVACVWPVSVGTVTAVTFQIAHGCSGCSDPNECRAFCVGSSLRRWTLLMLLTLCSALLIPGAPVPPTHPQSIHPARPARPCLACQACHASFLAAGSCSFTKLGCAALQADD